MKEFYTEGLCEAKYFSAFYRVFAGQNPKIWHAYQADEGPLSVKRFEAFRPRNGFGGVASNVLCQDCAIRYFNPPRVLLECMRRKQVRDAYVVVDDDVYVRYGAVDGQTKGEYQVAVEETHNEVLWQENNFEDFIVMHLPDDMLSLWRGWLEKIQEKNGIVNGKQMKGALNALIDNRDVDWDVVYKKYQNQRPQGEAAYSKRFFYDNANARKFFVYGLVRCWVRWRMKEGKNFGWVENLDDFICKNGLFTRQDFEDVIGELDRAENTKSGFFYGDTRVNSRNFRSVLERWCNAIG